MPFSIKMVKRAIASTDKASIVDSALLDLTSTLFSMRAGVYTIAQSKAVRNKREIVTFGEGRFQEWKQMMTDNTSYKAIQPDIDTTLTSRKMKRATLLLYDFNTSSNTQVVSVSKIGFVILCAMCTLDHFKHRVMPIIPVD